MTKEREEEIRQYLKERNIPFTSLEANSIIEGIEWADAHPNPNGKEIIKYGASNPIKFHKATVEELIEFFTKQKNEGFLPTETLKRIGGLKINKL